MNTTLIEKEFKDWKTMFSTIEDQLFSSSEIVRDFMWPDYLQ